MEINKNIKVLILLLLLSFLGGNYKILAQSFEHIETSSGLSILQENKGVAVADYDGDFDLDIFVVAESKDIADNNISHSRLFRNNNDGTFEDVTEIAGLSNLLPEADYFNSGAPGFKNGVFWGDYDNDGFPDIFLTNSSKVQLFHNEGDGTFTEVTSQAGILSINNCGNSGASWFDFNNDGFLDLYINEWGSCQNNTFYENNGDGTFQNRSDILPATIQNEKISFVSIPHDFNNDGWVDLYISNDFGNPNYLLLNNNGTGFTENATAFGIDNMEPDMGLSIMDYNNDGLFDIYSTTVINNVLFTNQGNNTYINTATENNINTTGWSWDVVFADFDNDGDEDSFIVNGFEFYAAPPRQNNFYLRNQLIEGQNGFIDASEEVSLNDLTISLGATDFDYDHDGDLDLFVTNVDGPSYFYENKIINGTQSPNINWFQIALEGTISNRNAIGTSISITTNLGEIHRYYHGVGFLSQSLQPVHFGLGAATQIQSIEIKWPSGLTETHENLPLNSFIAATEGNGFEILDIQPADKLMGCTDPNSCNYNPLALINDNSCTYLEANDIVGSTNSGFLKTEVYSYPLVSNGTANWEITGGEIIEGQGTNTITVKWNLEESGTVSVIESTTACSSTSISINVNLSLTEISNDLSIARLWNEALLQAIRNDFARPTVHARNLFHTSIAIYDSWAIYNNTKPYLLGNEVHNYTNTFNGFRSNTPKDEAIKKTMSYACYRLLKHRFENSPGASSSQQLFNILMEQLGYDVSITSVDYSTGDPARLGNYIAQSIINYGFTDGSREQTDYNNAYYSPVNQSLAPAIPGNSNIEDPNRWQSLSLDEFVDQSGNLIPGTSIDFLSPEWGNVSPFALTNDVKTTYQKDGNNFIVYHDPNEPPSIDTTTVTVSGEAYKWGFSLVSKWSSHLDPTDNVLQDISPRSIGNIDINSLPTNFQDYPNFYNEVEGGDIGNGRDLNPYTNAPYVSQIVPRGDYTRVLAEFWADGPDSETPPGHWFTILNYVNDNALLIKKLNGEGDILSTLEWDVKSYFILGGAMHDAAISAWGIKGWYDYLRPISAIRFMADKGQSSDASLSNYHVAGIPLEQGFVEIVETGDELAGRNNEHIGKIKLYAWQGPSFITDPQNSQAGVGWILAENWWPYQRPNFVTPPFAGYVSGHSTYSRAAAEVLTKLTGSEYFPGGIGEFVAKKNEFLVFEEGPSQDVTLQWATYRDASDQCSLSRIWGGIHPPADDIPGRLIGEQIGQNAFDFATNYFTFNDNSTSSNHMIVFPNPIKNDGELTILNTKINNVFSLFDILGKQIAIKQVFIEDTRSTKIAISNLSSGIYILKVDDNRSWKIIVN